MACIANGVDHGIKHDGYRARTWDKGHGVLPLFSNNISLRHPTIIKRRHNPLRFCVFALIHIGAVLQAPELISGQPPIPNGIQPLIHLENQSLHQMIPLNTRPLLLPQELERFLHDLEGLPPDWNTLQNPDHVIQSERLFELNRTRDEARLVRKNFLHQPIAFLWSGILRQYLPEYKGFSLAIGPELTSTSWGIVRFKPIGLPDYLVAIPSPESAGNLLARRQQGEQIEIVVLFIGTLITDESLIYGFSHDGKQGGMILPVVKIQGVKYFMETP